MIRFAKRKLMSFAVSRDERFLAHGYTNAQVRPPHRADLSAHSFAPPLLWADAIVRHTSTRLRSLFPRS
jgi:hypothetical protein